jgi:hypothetical protein
MVALKYMVGIDFDFGGSKDMKIQIGRIPLFLVSLIGMMFISIPYARAQQTLGGITGTVTDTSGAVVVNATVTLVGDQTKLTRTQTTNTSGLYLLVNLPIGAYTLTFTQAGFQTLSVPAIQVQANRTATVNAELKVGNVTESITVEETPLMNAVDTTNGYVMDKLEIEDVPLPTGSFTGLAILSPGVNAELSSGTGANAGLGNAPIWANGQRDTSNTFLLNGVSAYSLFNGKSTSQVASARVVNNTGIGTTSALSSVPVQSSASIYLAIGESIPSPPQETITEVRVNTSMYDAQQGSSSGAHIDVSTGSGTNNIHGSLYLRRGTNWLNADPYFYNADPNIPPSEKNPGLHRYAAGAVLGVPIIKDKLFFYGSYQYTRASDDEIGISRAFVPPGLTNDRSASGLATVANNNNLSSILFLPDTTALPQIGIPANCALSEGGIPTACPINPIAYALFNYKLPNGQFMIPNANPNAVALNTSNPALVEAFPEDAEVPGTALFLAHQAVADLDWNPNSSHSFSAKYYYQHDPTIAPYAYSMFAGFAQHLDAGSQVVSLSHTQIVKSNLSVTETFGFIREKAYSTIDQPFTPQQFSTFAQSLPEVKSAIQSGAITAADTLVNTFGSPLFPGIGVVWAGTVLPSYPYSMYIGGGSAGQGAFTGVFQNRFNPSADAIWSLGKHTVTFGGSYGYTQLNTRDRRNQYGMIDAEDINQFLQGTLTDNYLYNITAWLVGNPNRYWRANDTGLYVQDKYQFRSNLSVTAGLRFDWNGGLTEKYGNLLNFDPASYKYNPVTDTITSNGLIVAGNNATAATKGVSNTTLTGRQWGLAPRIGVAWSPKMFNSKLVVRAGWGIYYDRGELYAYLSPGLTQNITNGGPFGINQQQPFVNTQFCPTAFAGSFLPCLTTLSNPWGTTLGPEPTGSAGSVGLSNACAIYNASNFNDCTATGSGIPFYLGAYARANKLPYTLNSTLDIQWQPRNDLAIDIGYVNALGRHEIIPVPFNQARIASPSNPLCGTAAVCASPNSSPYAQSYTYGYTVQTCNTGGFDPCPANLPGSAGPMLVNPEGGNVDLRVPYIGYAAESELYTAVGISAYNALQAHVEKRLSHGLAAGVSYTFSRSLDEQSALGLFYNGNNPLNLRDGYGPSDYDRTHVFNIDYHYELPKFYGVNTWEGKVADGWAVQGLVTLQSGQPYSVVDYSGAIGSAFYSIYDGITNPIDPLNFSAGCTPQNAVTGASGANPNSPALKASCFTIPLLSPGALNGAIPGPSSNNPFGDTFETAFTSGQRNIFRQPWQKRADISILKLTQVTERVAVKYSFDVYNLTNTPSFDIPIDNVTQNAAFSQFPVQGTNPVPSPATCALGNPFPSGNFYNCPTGLGQVTKTIGSSRQIQMSLSVQF